MDARALGLEMLVMFLLMMLGYFAYRKRLLTEEGVKGVSSLVTWICAPAMGLSAALGREGALDPGEFFRAMGLSAAVFAVLIAASFLICLVIRAPKEEWYSYQLPTIFGNIGFIGFPVCLAVLGEGSLFYVSISTLLYNLLVFTYGKHLLAGAAARAGIGDQEAGKGGLFRLIKPALNVGTLSALLAIAIYLLDPPVPEVVNSTMTYAGNATVFLSMLVLGCTLAASSLKRLFFGGARMYVFLAIRMLVLPIALVSLLKLFVHDPLPLGTMSILVSLPGGSIPIMFCKEMGLEAEEMSRGIILSTVFCVATIPVVCLFL